MSGSKNVCKIIKEAILEMVLHNQLDVESSGFCNLSSLTTMALCPSLASPSHLPSQSPMMLMTFRTDKQVRIVVHTRAQSTFLLGQAMMICFGHQSLSPGNDQLALQT